MEGERDKYGHINGCCSSWPKTHFDPALPRTLLYDLRPVRLPLWASGTLICTCWTGLPLFPCDLGQIEGDMIQLNLPKNPSSPTRWPSPGRGSGSRGGATLGASCTHGNSLSLGPNQAWDLERKFRQTCCCQPGWAHAPPPSSGRREEKLVPAQAPTYSVLGSLPLSPPHLALLRNRTSSPRSAGEPQILPPHPLHSCRGRAGGVANLEV